MSFLGNLGKKAVEKAYDLASKVDGGRDYLASAANTVNSLVKGTDARVHLKPGNVIQIICRASARSIQIVVANDSNELICDAIGGTGPFFPNAYWLVVIGSHGRFFFHNNFNYLAVKNGCIGIIPSSPNEKPPAEAEFRVQDVLGSSQAIYLESTKILGFFLSFDENGTPGNGTKTKTNEKECQFEITLVAYGPGIQPEKGTNPIESPTEAAPPPYWAATNASPAASASAASPTTSNVDQSS